MKSKRGFFFILDAIIALFVVVIGLVLFFSFYLYEPAEEQTALLSFDLMGFLTENKVSDINDPYAGSAGTLHMNGNITDLQHTLIEQIAEFYYRNSTKNDTNAGPLIEPYINATIQNVIPENYGVSIRVEGVEIYSKKRMQAVDMEDSVILIPSKKLVYGTYNREELFGPYVVEVFIWR